MKKAIIYLITTLLITTLLCSCAGTATSTVVNMSSKVESDISSTTTEATSSYISSLQVFGDASSEDISSLLAQASSQTQSVNSKPQRVVVKKVVTTTYSNLETSSAQVSSTQSEEATSVSQIKVMPIGEITTLGGVPDSNSSAYRQLLADKYSSLGVSTKYIGTQNLASGQMKDGNIYHCAFSDATAKNIFENHIENIIKCEAPDIIILMLGRNDIIQNTNVNDFLTYFIQIIDKLKTAYPQAKIYLPSVVPVRAGDGSELMSDSDIEKAYFEAIKLVANQKQVEFVDMSANNSKLDFNCYTDQATHYTYPNQNGYEKIAETLFKATENTVNSLKK